MMWRWKIAQAAEIRWWQLYLKDKDPKAYLAWKGQYWTNLLANIGLEHIPENAKCLDAGSSLAGIFMVLKSQEVLAIDPLMEAYQKELPNFFQPQWYTHTLFEKGMLEHIKCQDQFDYVFCLNVINHVKDIKAALDKLWGSLKAGGTLVLSIDAHNYEIFKHIFRWIPADVLHPYQYNLKEYMAMLQAYAPEQKITVTTYKKEFFFNYYILQIQKPL